ncbi:phospho-sugar mutase [Streptomyces sp.]|uniref:phospho-sugar mutase n=1 Tax=Streptomyces sp. TaxID=1931 RepID=UPI002F41AB02
MTELLSRVRAWIAEDPDPETREELEALLAAAEKGEREAVADLTDRFAGTLEFGTAGLRGELGGGPRRMNRAVVVRAAAGLAGYLRARGGGLVVIGYDARHKSYEFALDTAAVMVGAGLRAAVLPRALPTPVLAYAIRHLGAAAGVMVTASHNPPRDNGYKVYLGDGSQIVPPADAEIAAEIAAVGPIGGTPELAEGAAEERGGPRNERAGSRTQGSDVVPRAAEGWEVLGEDVVAAYLDRAAGVVAEGGVREVNVVYTPLHGVGLETLTAAFARAGFPAPTPVVEQAEPHPDFPTVAFPNPEEPGAMDLAFKAAQAAHPDIVIANDPDADRCAVAVPDPASASGWRMLRGDELGALLAVHLVRTGAVASDQDVFAASIVSSSLLSKIAAGAGVGYEDTLTGFKWIGRVPGLRYGYEEALGYCVDPAGVRDKDGITAALLVAELAALLKAESRTLAGLLDEIALTHGLHATDQLSVRVADLSLIGAAMARLREHPPVTLAGLTVTTAEDLGDGAAGLPPTDGLRYRLAADPARGVASARVVVRPSGTEPKLKCYLEVVVPVGAASELDGARATAARVLAAVKSDLSAAAGI